MPFSGFATAPVSRALSLLTERPEDFADALFEATEVLEIPPDGEPPGIRRRRETGLAVRLLRGGEAWTVSRDGFARDALRDAVRRVARAYPRTAFPLPDLQVRVEEGRDEQTESELEDLSRLPSRLGAALRQRRVAFPMRVTVRRFRRDLQIVGPRVAAPLQRELFSSLEVETPWRTFGTLHAGPVRDLVEPLADRLVEGFRARDAAPPGPGTCSLVLGSQATAVVLHEAVAHALEADTLATSGPPEAALGIDLAAPCVSVVDDPGAAPEAVRRATDDEGVPVLRRWLLREGVVEQILADRAHSGESDRLEPGAGRRASRHQPVVPRSFCLELLPGSGSLDDLLSGVGEGLYVGDVERGTLDGRTGCFEVQVAYARRIRDGRLAEPVGRFHLRARVADLLSRVVAVGGEARTAGAGWCAKGGQLLPVWATTPAMVIEGLEIDL